MNIINFKILSSVSADSENSKSQPAYLAIAMYLHANIKQNLNKSPWFVMDPVGRYTQWRTWNNDFWYFSMTKLTTCHIWI